jgi:hydrogenase maturation protein HypF
VAGTAVHHSQGTLIRRRLRVGGIVQGVGFRPRVFQLAAACGLAGWVLNNEQGVMIEVEGPAAGVETFQHDLIAHPPPMAMITTLAVEDLPPAGYTEFRIEHSQRGAERTAGVPADSALCADCRQDVLEPGNRRFGYAFTNCTNCGPRFTIVQDIPYDRPKTTMAAFPMCPACDDEYHNPLDRRFHAQPDACPVCGPHACMVDAAGREMAGATAWRDRAAEMLRWGLTLAVKGLGGFHLACDAGNSAAVQSLRERKHRPHRPFAIMVRDMETVRRICSVSPGEEQLLTSPAAPIVLLERLRTPLVCDGVAPGLDRLGVMLPYTPLHLLLMEQAPPVLVMTSGNPTGLPLCIDNDEARLRLGQIADGFLVHNRPIHIPCDDSVMLEVDGEPLFLRRSRGYVPREVRVRAAASGSKAPAVVGIGGDMKNVFCLLQGQRAVFSQHLGDQKPEESRANSRRALDHLQRLTGISPTVVAYDMHPGYYSSRQARALPADLHVPVQHHHAHLAACMADNGLEGEAIGLILDGTGYGTDGAIWGFEVLAGGYREFRRVAHLAYAPLPGGEGAIRYPLMAAAGLIWQYFGENGLDRAGIRAPEWEVARGLLKTGINCPPAGSAGRLFDAVSALMGICRLQTYEGQAPIELGAAADDCTGGPYPFQLDGGELYLGLMLDEILTDLERGVERGEIAGRFLGTVVAMAVAGARQARLETGLNDVCLGGGTFQSAWLLHRVSESLAAEGFTVHRPRNVPPGDGGIALGQALIARERWEERCV